MLRAFAVAAALSGLAAPALATEWVSCADPAGAASFDYLAGDGLGVLAVVAMTITAGEKVWATDPANGPGDPVQVGQAFEDADTVRIDAVDDQYSAIAHLRLFRTTEGDSDATGGTLRIPGQGAWTVSCTGP